MTKEAEAQRILQFYAAKFNLDLNRLFIAGGWAANPFRANDIDIWYTTPGVGLWNDEYRRLGNLIYGGENWIGENFGTCEDLTELKELEWFGKPVQIFETPYTIPELLNEFDLSCHRYAIAFDGCFLSDPKATHPIYDEINVLTPEHTFEARLKKLQERYGHVAVAYAKEENDEILI